MKSIDLQTILTLILIDEDNPSLKKISQLGLMSISQAFDSIDRLSECRLIDKNTKRVLWVPLETFLLFALPYVIPGKIQNYGNGLALTLTEVPTISSTSGMSSLVWVWPCKNHSDAGMAIEPLTETISLFVDQNSEFAMIISAIEISRFHDHPLREKAHKIVKDWILKKTKKNQHKVPVSLDSDILLEKLSRLFSETGFRHTDLEKISIESNVSIHEIEKKFGTMTDIQILIGSECAARAYAHLGSALSSKSDGTSKAVQKSLRRFFDFLDHNEDYFRLGLWFYVERIFDVTTESGVLKDQFFESLEEYFADIPSEKSKHARAALFANIWLTYAWFRWVEFPRMKNRDEAELRREELKNVLIQTLV